jgi:hypothetical protein
MPTNTQIQTITLGTKLFFSAGITSRNQVPDPVWNVTFTIQELLDGRKIEHEDQNGSRGWLEIKNGKVDISYLASDARRGRTMALKDWLAILNDKGSDLRLYLED